MTTTIATNKNSTLVTSVFIHETKSDGVTVHSSITTGNDGVTVHSSITTKGKTVTLPPVTPVEPKTAPKVLVITNGSVSYITRIKGGVVYDARFIILITSSVLAFILLICVIIFVFLKRSGRRYVCCISCKNCRRRKSIPDIEVYRHSVRTDSPDVVQLDEMNRGAVEPLPPNCECHEESKGSVAFVSQLSWIQLEHTVTEGFFFLIKPMLLMSARSVF
ncbi:hypothetical protein OS493_032840 [Desmophyllum pertusum]|uniref:Uncharacterized protein n=1 Tax=Desmophyllum pertusum TaxID=174260 RepID=A0A9W9YVS2_9CNID|nr:hypothetical protein OS493_032840 [Desmophyllum pertusum]